MDWKTYYQERHLTADEAVKHIKSGNRVLVGHACGEPSFLLDTMIGHKEDYENVEIVHMVAMGKCEYCQPGMEKHFHHNAYFVGARTRDAINSGCGDFTPCFFYQVPETFHTTMPLDVELLSVTPTDENGMVSLGVSVDYDYEAVMTAKIVIAQVNDQMPFTYGKLIPVDKFTYFVEFCAYHRIGSTQDRSYRGSYRKVLLLSDTRW